jgi:hypothetical protein
MHTLHYPIAITHMRRLVRTTYSAKRMLHQIKSHLFFNYISFFNVHQGGGGHRHLNGIQKFGRSQINEVKILQRLFNL